MEILFKDDRWIYYIRNNYLQSGSTERFLDKDLTNIPHLDDAEVLYHYKVTYNSSILLPVYYEHNDKFITKNYSEYTWEYISENLIKDYTLVNLKLL